MRCFMRCFMYLHTGYFTLVTRNFLIFHVCLHHVYIGADRGRFDFFEARYSKEPVTYCKYNSNDFGMLYCHRVMQCVCLIDCISRSPVQILFIYMEASILVSFIQPLSIELATCCLIIYSLRIWLLYIPYLYQSITITITIMSSAFITGIFGMNLDNTNTIQNVKGLFIGVVFAAILLIFVVYVSTVAYFRSQGILLS